MHHTKQIKLHNCDKCPATFTTSTGLRTHRFVHKQMRDFVCNIEGCSAAFKCNESLKRHLNSHLRLRKYECTDCHRDFTDSYKLKRHRQSFHVPLDPAQQASCPICGKTFKSSHYMQKHLIYHEPPKFICEICNKGYHSPVNLKSHIKSSHGGAKDFNCKYCESSYFKKSHLNRHIMTAHMKQKIVCQVAGCQQHFSRKERYKGRVAM